MVGSPLALGLLVDLILICMAAWVWPSWALNEARFTAIQRLGRHVDWTYHSATLSIQLDIPFGLDAQSVGHAIQLHCSACKYIIEQIVLHEQ